MARLNGAKRTVAVDYLALPVAARVDTARLHDKTVVQRLLDEPLPRVRRISSVLDDQAFWKLEETLPVEHGVPFEVKYREGRPKGEFWPIEPLWKVEDCFAQLGRWRRLARSFEATETSATACRMVAGRLRRLPPHTGLTSASVQGASKPRYAQARGAPVPDDDLKTMVREFRASVAAELEAQHRRIDDLSDEVRRRIGTAETAILNEIRDLSGRLDRRLERVEVRMGEIETRIGSIEQRLNGE